MWQHRGCYGFWIVGFVLAQVSDYVLSRGQGSFAEYHPVRFVCKLYFIVKSMGYAQFFELSPEAIQKLALKSLAQGIHRVKKLLLPDALPLCFERIPCSGHNAVDVGVQAQVLPPGVQHGNGPGLHPIFTIPKAVQGAPHGTEQQVIVKCGIP